MRATTQVFTARIQAFGRAMEKEQDVDAVSSGDKAKRCAEDYIYCFKIIPCSRRQAHNWQSCFCAHPGERARRRDLRTHKYAAAMCSDMSHTGSCPAGDDCEKAHSVFEYHLHPDKFRTKLCTDGEHCKRQMCFFAHSIDELRQPAAVQENTSTQTQQQVQALATATTSSSSTGQQVVQVLSVGQCNATAAAAGAEAQQEVCAIPNAQRTAGSSSAAAYLPSAALQCNAGSTAAAAEAAAGAGAVAQQLPIGCGSHSASTVSLDSLTLPASWPLAVLQHNPAQRSSSGNTGSGVPGSSSSGSVGMGTQPILSSNAGPVATYQQLQEWQQAPPLLPLHSVQMTATNAGQLLALQALQQAVDRVNQAKQEAAQATAMSVAVSNRLDALLAAVNRSGAAAAAAAAAGVGWQGCMSPGHSGSLSCSGSMVSSSTGNIQAARARAVHDKSGQVSGAVPMLLLPAFDQQQEQQQQQPAPVAASCQAPSSVGASSSSSWPQVVADATAGMAAMAVSAAPSTSGSALPGLEQLLVQHPGTAVPTAHHAAGCVPVLLWPAAQQVQSSAGLAYTGWVEAPVAAPGSAGPAEPFTAPFAGNDLANMGDASSATQTAGIYCFGQYGGHT